MDMSKTRSGFTLIELLVVLTIVGLLAALLFPVFAKARERGRLSACADNLRQLHLACALYAADNSNLLPPYVSRLAVISIGSAGSGAVCAAPDPALMGSVKPYSHSDAIWRCPDDNRQFGPGFGEGAGCGPAGTLVIMNLPLFTSYFYRAADLTEQGIIPVNIDRSIGSLGPSNFPLLEDEARCSNDNSSPSVGYPSYNHRGEWNRVYLDGHIKTFTYDCTDPIRPVEK